MDQNKATSWISWIILCLLIGSLLVSLMGIRNRNQALAIAERNWKIAQDSLVIQELKSGALLAERDAYILSTEAMAQELQLSKSQVRELEKKLHSSWEIISQIQSEAHIDTIEVPVEVSWWGDSMKINFAYSDRWVVMDGVMCVNPNNSFMMLNNLTLNLPLTVGMTQDKTFFATSDNPYIHFTDIKSAVNLETMKKKKRWTIGLNVGPGIYYDILHNNLGLGVGLQVGLNFNF